MQKETPLFELGKVVITPGALSLMDVDMGPINLMLMLHVTGHWGDLDEHDIRENELALKQGNRIFSAYHLDGGQKIWVITEADRSSTTILLPSEY